MRAYEVPYGKYLGFLWEDCSVELVYFLRGLRHFWADPHEDRFARIDMPACPLYGCASRWNAATKRTSAETQVLLTWGTRSVQSALPAMAEPLTFLEVCALDGRRFVVFSNHGDNLQNGVFGYIEMPFDDKTAEDIQRTNDEIVDAMSQWKNQAQGSDSALLPIAARRGQTSRDELGRAGTNRRRNRR